MLLKDKAHNLAIKLGKEKDYAFVQALKDDIIGARASIISNMTFDRNTLPSFYQTISKFKIESVRDEILDCTVEKIKIPKPLTLKTGKYILQVTNRIGNTAINVDVISLEDEEYIEYRKFTSKSFYLLYDGENLIAKNISLSSLNGFHVKGIFSNPLEVYNYKNSSGCNAIDSCMIDDELDIEDIIMEKINIIILNQYKNIFPPNEILVNEN
jgi:hypothetical protein